MYRLNMLRWRLARWIAPDKIVAAPTGGDRSFLFIQDGNSRVWVRLDTFKLKTSTNMRWRPPLGDSYALGTVTPHRTGRLIATFGQIE